MGKRKGELSVTEVASVLEVHRNTVLRWAQCAVHGEPSRLSNVRVDLVGRYYVPEEEVQRVRFVRISPDGV